MSARDELAQIIESVDEASGWDVSPDAYAMYGDAVLAAGYRKPRTISAAEELANVERHEPGTVIRDAEGWVYATGASTNSWYAPGSDERFLPEDVVLPAMVLWEPRA